MNGSCAGGTGAFIDQMATLLKMSADEMNKAAEKAERTYTIASRCGVFAKSDVQPLINQGARTEISPPASTRRWSTRPLPVWHRAAPSRAISCIWAGR